MYCPKCNSKSSVKKTIFKKDFTVRYRRCLNNKCGHRFKTTETIATGWDYKSICRKIKEQLREVSF